MRVQFTALRARTKDDFEQPISQPANHLAIAGQPNSRLEQWMAERRAQRIRPGMKKTGFSSIFIPVHSKSVRCIPFFSFTLHTPSMTETILNLVFHLQQLFFQFQIQFPVFGCILFYMDFLFCFNLLCARVRSLLFRSFRSSLSGVFIVVKHRCRYHRSSFPPSRCRRFHRFVLIPFMIGRWKKNSRKIVLVRVVSQKRSKFTQNTWDAKEIKTLCAHTEMWGMSAAKFKVETIEKEVARFAAAPILLVSLVDGVISLFFLQSACQ